MVVRVAAKREAEIPQPGVEIAVDQHVGGFDVPVDDGRDGGMQGFDGFGGL